MNDSSKKILTDKSRDLLGHVINNIDIENIEYHSLDKKGDKIKIIIVGDASIPAKDAIITNEANDAYERAMGILR